MLLSHRQFRLQARGQVWMWHQSWGRVCQSEEISPTSVLGLQGRSSNNTDDWLLLVVMNYCWFKSRQSDWSLCYLSLQLVWISAIVFIIICFFTVAFIRRKGWSTDSLLWQMWSPYSSVWTNGMSFTNPNPLDYVLKSNFSLFPPQIPCKHVFCYDCALLHEKKGDKMCPG